MPRFGRKKKQPPPSFDETAERLGNRTGTIELELDKLNEKIKVLTDKIRSTKNPAACASDKRRAMELMRRRNILMQQLGQVENQKFNVDQMAYTQESIQTAKDTVDSMKYNLKVMRKTLKKINLNDAEKNIADMEGMMEDMQEIGEILGGEMGDPINEADLQEEFMAFEQELDNGSFEFENPGAAPVKTEV